MLDSIDMGHIICAAEFPLIKCLLRLVINRLSAGTTNVKPINSVNITRFVKEYPAPDSVGKAYIDALKLLVPNVVRSVSP